VKTKHLWLLAVLGATLARAETNDVIQVWPGIAPGAEQWQGREFADESMVRPTLTVFLPPKEKANGAAVLICPGGGYQNCMYTYEGYDIARWFNERGIAGFVLRYRRPVQGKERLYDHSVPAADAHRALRLIRHRAAEWGVNPQKVGVIGFSAGGHLAATLDVHFDDEPRAANADPVEVENARPDFTVLVYAVVNMNDEAIMHAGSKRNLMGEAAADPKLSAYYSCEQQVTSNTPPTFLVTAADDPTVKAENSIRMYQALKSHGVPAELHIFEKGGHGFGMKNPNKTVTQQWPGLLAAWLRDHGFIAK
jgi:acetyl esterase/lipase